MVFKRHARHAINRAIKRLNFISEKRDNKDNLALLEGAKEDIEKAIKDL
jgi:hypothetical protein